MRRIAVAIVSTDDIRVRWGDARRALRCVRYRPRNVEAEVTVRDGARAAPEAAAAWLHRR